MHAIRRIALIAAAAACVGGCGWMPFGGSGGPAVERKLDIGRGTIDGVGIGSPVSAVVAAFGEPVGSQTGGLWPADEGPGFHGPNALPVPDDMGRDGPRILRYPGVAFLVADDVVFAVIGGRGMATEDGVRVGDDLAVAREAHGPLGCRERPSGEPLWPDTTAETYPECQRRLGTLRLLVTGDPIASISVGALRP